MVLKNKYKTRDGKVEREYWRNFVGWKWRFGVNTNGNVVEFERLVDRALPRRGTRDWYVAKVWWEGLPDVVRAEMLGSMEEVWEDEEDEYEENGLWKKMERLRKQRLTGVSPLGV